MMRHRIILGCIISCLIHGILILPLANITIPRRIKEKDPINVDIIEISEISPRPRPTAVERGSQPQFLDCALPETTHYSPALLPGAPLAHGSASSEQPTGAAITEPSPFRCGTVFLLDASESMVVGIDRAKEILIDRIEKLPQKEIINIAYFSTDVRFFSPHPLQLSDGDKKEALKFCREIDASGNLDVAAGLENAINMNPSRIILISDGLTGDRELAYEQIRKARKEGVVIDSVLIRRRPFDENILKRAAYLTGGNFSILPVTAAVNPSASIR